MVANSYNLAKHLTPAKSFVKLSSVFWKVLDSFCLHSLVADVKMHHLPLSTGSNVWIGALSVIGPEMGRGTLLWLFYFKVTE